MAMVWVGVFALAGGCMQETGGAKTTAKKGPFPLALHLKADPSSITINSMPRTGNNNRPQPKDVLLTLTVTNDRKTDYHGEWTDTGVTRFWVTDPLKVIWQSNDAVQPMLTKIDLAPGESKTYRTLWHIDDARDLRGKKIQAHAKFLPEDLVTKISIPVEEIH
jgi:hypothetical protein